MNAAAEGAATTASTASRSSVVLPRATRAIAGIVIAGVLVQALLAGGLLAGRGPVGTLHEPIGHQLTLMGVLPLLLGLAGRLRTKEQGRVLGLRTALAAMTVAAMVLGTAAADGARDLLMLHIPIAIVTMSFAAQLMRAVHDASG